MTVPHNINNQGWLGSPVEVGVTVSGALGPVDHEKLGQGEVYPRR